MGNSPAGNSYIEVALPVPLDRYFTYMLPEGAAMPGPGARVMVPFGRRVLTGYVISSSSSPPEDVAIKAISKVIDDPPLISAGLMTLARKMADYYVQPLGIVLRAVLPPAVKGTGRKKATDLLSDRFPGEVERPALTAEQEDVLTAVTRSLDGGKADSFLLHGVTGSGKTEVYLRAIEEALKRNKTAIVLVPEIALIPQSTARFQRRFGERVAVLHSRLTGPQRSTIWKKASAGEIRVVIGPRSAVFVPLPDIGIVVVDEEQDSSFKQDERPHYNAVTVAGWRCEQERAVLLLGSATPSLESWNCCRVGSMRGYGLSGRPAGGEMPVVEVVDMRGSGGLFSEELLSGLQECVAKGEQAIILINRRGHANYLQCTDCGWIERCPHCSISLTYHSLGDRLVCHYCAFRQAPPDQCPRCGGYNVLQRGAGTQRVEMELRNLVPSARVLRMDLDTTTGKTGHLDLLEAFGRGEADVLMGTQMVAKGHHYPDVTLVGILSADAGLNFPDFRAAERTFQLLSQAAGRTGRGRRKGRVIVQALSPEHYIYDHIVAHDFDGFASVEMTLREQLGYPPARGLVLMTLSSRSAGNAREAAGSIRAALTGMDGVSEEDLLGPAPALIEKLRGSYRFHLLLKGDRGDREKRCISEAAYSAVEGSRGLSLQFDVDPVNLF